MERVALIIGGSSGLGKMAAILLAEQGWRVAISSRYPQQEMGNNVTCFPADVCHQEGAQQLVNEVMGRWGRIDALIHAVGPFIRERKLFLEHSGAEILEMVQGNLLSAMWIAHAVLPVMRRQQSGRILFFGFARSAEAPAWPDRSVYAAAKTGLVSFTKTLAVEEASSGITVNIICPGDIVGERKEARIHEVISLTDAQTPRGRPGSGEDVARVISFLLAPDSDFITGNVINVTGGLDVIHPVSKRNSTPPSR